ncbi:MAG: UDP-N-acetylmuramyl pentapeptide phosphotransferase [Brevibacillus sp.]|nr:UDP-N-acetylmuramyl pentapeptide phosphotransferase [Brevibacillus sp.]
MTGVELFALLLLSALLPALLHRLGYRRLIESLKRHRLIRQNYRGRQVPTSGGLLIAGCVTLTLLTLTVISWAVKISAFQPREMGVFLCGSLLMLLLGWQDDRADEKEVKGFRGHLCALWSERRITSGLVKCVGGGLTALLISAAVSGSLAELVVHTALLALSCNVINLFDLRPTRAIKVFWLAGFTGMAAVPALFSSLVVWVWVLPVLSATVMFFRHDARGEVMLGDAGANYLGFLLGFGCLMVFPFWIKVLILLVLTALQLLAEVISFSRVIQSVPLLRRLDEWGRTT